MRAVAYYRVSTAAQGRSGLGLDAQREAVESLCKTRSWDLIAPPFTEVESGKRADRPELAKALQRAKVTGATLVVAKLDRLSRNAAFLLTLRDSGVEFIAADMPDASNLTVGIMALVAQQEREAISKRTKEALAAAKARGTRLGNPNGTAAIARANKGNAASAAARASMAQARAELMRADIERFRDAGVTSLAGIAAKLNEDGARTAQGKRWHASSVRNLLARLEA